MTSSILKFDDLVEGTEYGPFRWEVKEETNDKYLEAVEEDHLLYTDTEYARAQGYSGRVAPPTIGAIYLLEAYRESFPNRPPGVIHARQLFEFFEPIYINETLFTKIKIIEKYIRKGRCYLKVEGITEKENGPVVSRGIMTVIWPDS